MYKTTASKEIPFAEQVENLFRSIFPGEDILYSVKFMMMSDGGKERILHLDVPNKKVSVTATSIQGILDKLDAAKKPFLKLVVSSV